MVHRLAFRTLVGFDPSPAECLAFHDARRDVFAAAARAKIARAGLPAGAHLHLTSRDLLARLREAAPP